MNYEYRRLTLEEAIAKSLAPEHAKRMRRLGPDRQSFECKASFDVWAPPLFWGPWVEIFVEIRITPEPNRKRISYSSLSRAKSSFDVEIKGGGGQRIRDVGPGSTLVTTPGNSITSLKIRAKSHSVGQHIRVSVR